MKKRVLSLPVTLVLTGCAVFLGLNAQAANILNNEYTPLQKARKYTEVEKLAAQRLAADPGNVEALVAKSGAILAQGEEKRIEEALKLAEACVAAHPQETACHNALGEVLGSKAQAGSIFSAMGYAGKIRDAFARAIELDAKNWQARFNLMSYYLAAPAIVGGGKDKVTPLLAETAKISPDAARYMQARLDLMDAKTAQAESGLLAMRPESDEVLQRSQRELLYNVALKYGGDKKMDDAERVLREMGKRWPDSDLVPLGQARLLNEQGKLAEAVALYEKAAAIDARPQTLYRLGMALQALQDKSRAANAYEKALGQKVGLSKTQRSDAEERLKQVRS